MFLTFLPTSKKAKVTETLSIDPGLTECLSYRVPFKKEHYKDQDEYVDSILDCNEVKPDFVLMQNLGVPLRTGIIMADKNIYPGTPFTGNEKVITIGFDAQKNLYQTLDPEIKPEIFSSCLGWGNIVNFNDLIFNMLARATGLKTRKQVITPNRFVFNFVNKKGEINKQDFLLGYPHPEVDGDSYFAFHEKTWVRSDGKIVLDLNTGDLSVKTIEATSSPLYMLEVDNYHYQSSRNFKFSKSVKHTPGYYRVLRVNVPTTIDDIDVGKKLYDALGVTYDIYDEVKMKDGFIDPEIFMSGKHHFGVLKSKVFILDELAIRELADKRIAEEEKLADAFGVDKPKDEHNSIFNRRNKSFDTRHYNFMLNEVSNSYLTINHDGELDNALLKNLLQNWKINSLINTLTGGNSTVKENLYLLKTLIVSKEVYIPILTPRLDETVNAHLNQVLQSKLNNNLNQVNIVCTKNNQELQDYFGSDDDILDYLL